MAKLSVKWSRSHIGAEDRERRTIRALGLRRLHQVVQREDTPTLRGMLFKVRHLVDVREATGEEGA